MDLITRITVILRPGTKTVGRVFETELGLRSYLRVESSGLANNDLYVYFDDLTTLENAIETLKKLRVLMASKKEGEVRDGSTTVA